MIRERRQRNRPEPDAGSEHCSEGHGRQYSEPLGQPEPARHADCPRQPHGRGKHGKAEQLPGPIRQTPTGLASAGSARRAGQQIPPAGCPSRSLHRPPVFPPCRNWGARGSLEPANNDFASECRSRPQASHAFFPTKIIPAGSASRLRTRFCLRIRSPRPPGQIAS